MVLQPRDRELLRELAHLRVIDREDARTLAGFQSRTRANARLLALVRAGLLMKRAAGTIRGGHKFLYALSIRGAKLLGTRYRAPIWNPNTTLAWSPTLEHQLAVNRLYIGLRHGAPTAAVSLTRWSTFDQPIAPTVRLIPDAYIEITTPTTVKAIFLEVDRGTETRRIWNRKVDAYLTLATSGHFAEIFQRPQFRVAVLAPTPRRLASLRACVARRTTKVFWFALLPSESGVDWLWQRRWLRPHGPDLHFFIS
jgi:hypothetical protein